MVCLKGRFLIFLHLELLIEVLFHFSDEIEAHLGANLVEANVTLGDI